MGGKRSNMEFLTPSRGYGRAIRIAILEQSANVSGGFLMTEPSADPSLVTVPLPSEEELARVIGESYDSSKTLNVIKMFAGTDDMYPAVVGHSATRRCSSFSRAMGTP
jgi:hypothetical protein